MKEKLKHWAKELWPFGNPFKRRETIYMSFTKRFRFGQKVMGINEHSRRKAITSFKQTIS